MDPENWTTSQVAVETGLYHRVPKKNGDIMAAKRQRRSAEFKSKVAFAALKGDKTLAQLWMRVRGFRRPDRSVEEAASARGSGDLSTQRHSAGCRDVDGPPLPGDRSAQDGARRAQKKIRR